MQTFLPYADYGASARVLDKSRLGNQCYRETKTLFSGGWPNHPASKMWVGHTHHLALYGLACACEMASRGGWRPEVVGRWLGFWTQAVDNTEDTGPPPWLGLRAFHESHKRALIFKMPDHYQKFWPSLKPLTPDDKGKLPYVWPTY